MNNLLSKIITFLGGKPVFSQTRETAAGQNREINKPQKEAPVSQGSLSAGSVSPASDTRGHMLLPIPNFVKTLWRKAGGMIPSPFGPKRVSDALSTLGIRLPSTSSSVSHCPHCASADCVRRGTRRKKLETVQLYLCKTCGRTFTPHLTRGKHYPLNIMLDAISAYNLGYSLEETCQIINSRANQQKTASFEAVPVGKGDATSPIPDTWLDTTTSVSPLSSNRRREGDLHSIPTRIGTQSVSEMAPSAGVYPPPRPVYHLQPSTLSNWLAEFRDHLPFLRMRDFVTHKYTPKDMVVSATLAHRQLYRFRFHRGKCQAIMQDHFHHRSFTPLREFLAMVPGECPHHYFQDSLRASEAPMTFSKTAMIVRAKQNFATKMAAFTLQSVAERKDRHESLQKFFLYNDSTTVATEVPVYLTRDDLAHMQTQLGFEITGDLPKLITGHIDILQIRNGQIHILDYKPNAAKEKPLEQLTLYAMALSRLTGLRLFEFKCAWFDEKDYFEFFPLHVLHKPKKARRRKEIATTEGTYLVNKNPAKIERIRPIL